MIGYSIHPYVGVNIVIAETQQFCSFLFGLPFVVFVIEFILGVSEGVCVFHIDLGSNDS
nr:hypothetical protein [uncultured bacterium]